MVRLKIVEPPTPDRGLANISQGADLVSESDTNGFSPKRNWHYRKLRNSNRNVVRITTVTNTGRMNFTPRVITIPEPMRAPAI